MKAADKAARPLSAFLLVDEAVQLVRRVPLTTLALYYVGSIPFIVGVLIFWASMSQSGVAYRVLPVASLGLALLFIWMKACQALYSSQLHSFLLDEPLRLWSWRRCGRVLANQAALHATSVFVLPVAIVLLFPLGWVYAAYQSATVLDNGEERDSRKLVQNAIEMAKLWPGQNHLVIWLLSPMLMCSAGVFALGLVPFLQSVDSPLIATMGMFYAFLFSLATVLLSPVATMMALNIVSMIFMVTTMLPGMAGFRGTFIDNPFLLINTTLIALTIGLLYLLLDPVLKSAYVLRCYYGQSLRTGADVRTQLRRARRRPLGIAVLIALVVLGGVATSASAQEVEEVAGASIVAGDLSEALDRELAKGAYTWRMPRETAPPSDNLFLLTLQEIATMFTEVFTTVLDCIFDILEAIVDWFMGDSRSPSSAGSMAGVGQALRISLALLLVALVGILAYFLVKLWRSRRQYEVDASAVAVPIVPDIEDEDTWADALPGDEWYEMALAFIAQKAYRKAVRSLFLGMLAYLAQRELVRIARYKSNREYTLELEGRGRHAVASLRAAFGGGVLIYEAAWYGGMDVTERQVERLLAHRAALIAEGEPVAQGDPENVEEENDA